MRVRVRRLALGEIVEEGDILEYAASAQLAIGLCIYGYGCCVGHVVEDHERYFRPEAAGGIEGDRHE